jgi:hypothetical protein
MPNGLFACAEALPCLNEANVTTLLLSLKPSVISV